MSRSVPSRRVPRMTLVTTVAVCLLFMLAFIRPEQLQVVLYKVLLVVLGAVIAFWLDRAMFPNSRPEQCANHVLMAAAFMRRSLIVLAAVLGLTMGL